MTEAKSKNGAEIGRFVANLYKKLTGEKFVYHYVNLTKNYISIKIDNPHLTESQLAEFDQEMRSSIWKDRYRKVNNRMSNPWYGKREKVLVQFTKL